MYFDWMMKMYLGKDTPRGDLAGDMKRSGDFPRCDDRQRLLRYLYSKNACDEAIGLFKRSFRDYEKSGQKMKPLQDESLMTTSRCLK
ncbi:MAG: YozE family protein [Clostridia bacterium]|nr:YozE family protein [Clostridia bacterium]